MRGKQVYLCNCVAQCFFNTIRAISLSQMYFDEHFVESESLILHLWGMLIAMPEFNCESLAESGIISESSAEFGKLHIMLTSTTNSSFIFMFSLCFFVAFFVSVQVHQ